MKYNVTVNGKKYETKQGDKVFNFKVRLKGKVKIRAVAGKHTDEIILNRVNIPNPSYKLSRKTAGGGNWT